MSGPTYRLREYLPDVYRHLFSGYFDSEVPKETRATCDNCTMCNSNEYPTGMKVRSFNPSMKCCTFHPSLANYLVGGILASDDESMKLGRERIREKISKGVGIAPRGVLAPRRYSLLYESGGDFFGNSKLMLCPYYDEGNCTVWKYREATCSTYFCKYVKGEHGKKYWEELKKYLATMEYKLALYAASKVVGDYDRLARWWEAWEGKGTLSMDEIEDVTPPESKRAEIWGDWRGREEEYYIKCFETVRDMTAAEFQAAAGIEERFLLAKVEKADRKAYRDDIPRNLKRNPELATARYGGNYFCTAQGGRDAFELNGIIYPLLDFFDGIRDYEEVCKEIEDDHNVLLNKGILTQLFFLGVLIEGP